jgi:sulfatase modifying factor 1
MPGAVFLRASTGSRIVGIALGVAGCAEAPPPTPRGPSQSPAPAATSTALPIAEAPPVCPDGMVLVDVPDYCAEPELRCLKSEHNKPNKITICHRFAEEPQRCAGATRRMRFCVDRFEYPNREGARSPVMVDWHDARALCANEGKRLCQESEWVAACEGPAHKPFPYGYVRDPDVCNHDNLYQDPSLDKIYARDARVAERELLRLDQAVPSGARAGCKSDLGVHDLTGNVDEWVALDAPRDRGGWAGLKGGAWGLVRNACRPVTTSHEAEFRYYFVSFRCCADARAPSDDPPAWKRPELPPPSKSIEQASRGFTPSLRSEPLPPWGPRKRAPLRVETNAEAAARAARHAERVRAGLPKPATARPSSTAGVSAPAVEPTPPAPSRAYAPSEL